MKKLFFLPMFILAGCGPRFIGNPPESLTEKVSLMERQMSEQAGKIEVLEHQNKKIKQDMELLKKSFSISDIPSTPVEPVEENSTPTDLDTLPPMPPSPIIED